MKRFHFPLERVLAWRRQQLELEEERLRRLTGERRQLQDDRQGLEREAVEARAAVLSVATVDACELAAMDSYQLYLKLEGKRLAAKEQDCDRRIDEQRSALTEARRRVELLDRLKSRRLNEWTREIDKEADALATEAFLARWDTSPSA